MPASPQTARLTLDAHKLRAGVDVLDVLEPALHAAVELANVVDELVAFAPGDLDPVVLRRYRLAELQAARDAFVDAAAALIVGEAAVEAEEEEPDA